MANKCYTLEERLELYRIKAGEKYIQFIWTDTDSDRQHRLLDIWNIPREPKRSFFYRERLTLTVFALMVPLSIGWSHLSLISLPEHPFTALMYCVLGGTCLGQAAAFLVRALEKKYVA